METEVWTMEMVKKMQDALCYYEAEVADLKNRNEELLQLLDKRIKERNVIENSLQSMEDEKRKMMADFEKKLLV